MILGDQRLGVIHNIKEAANKRDFTATTEIGDPEMTLEQRLKVVQDFWDRQGKVKTNLNSAVGHTIISAATEFLLASTKITGLENIRTLPKGGAIVTANHFNQVDALTVKKVALHAHHKLDIVIEDTNLKLPGAFGYIMNNMGSIPLVHSPNYIGHDFQNHLQDSFNKDRWVLIFPEQEMWWNYRKPRPTQRGAYYFAAKHNVPVISTFVEIRDLPKLEKQNSHFYQTRYIIHVLPTIFPNPSKSPNANATCMAKKDYEQKVDCYETVYGKKLDYNFTQWDIAGWRGE